MRYNDQVGRELQLLKTPSRIISLVPSITELLVDMGLEQQLIGITKFCVHPTYLRREKTIVGGTKNISIEKIKKLSPDIIIANKEENTKAIVQKCEAIAPTYVSDITSIEDCLSMVQAFGKIFSKSQEASRIETAIQDVYSNFTLKMKHVPKTKVLYLIWKEPYMAVGKQTFIDSLLEINKFENVIHQDRYPEISQEVFEKATLILLSSEPFPFKEKHAKKIEKLFGKTTMLVDGEAFSWYGTRLLQAFNYFEKLHELRT